MLRVNHARLAALSAVNFVWPYPLFLFIVPRPRESSLVTRDYNVESTATNAAESPTHGSYSSPHLSQCKQLSHLIYIQWLTGKRIIVPSTL